tara:strand:- start:2850 stop:3416 length:567 start_codon:yes stop_codon:yes gene_type:complete
MTQDNQDNDMREMAENFLAVPGMENLIVDILTPKILERLEDYGINRQTTAGMNGGVSNNPNQPLNPNQDQPLQYPQPVPVQPPAPEVQQKQSLDANQIISLVQALLPVLGPALGLTAPASQNGSDSALANALQTYGQIEGIKVQAQNNLLENLTMLTGTLTNRTDRDPAEVMGQLAEVNLNNKTNETK